MADARRPEPGAGPDLLVVDDLTVRYGGVVAVDHVSFTATAGSFTGLIGPNGAGKTSLIDALTGNARSSGRITFRGASLDRLPPHRRARSGLARTFQTVELFDDLTVEENLLVAMSPPGPLGCLARLVRAPRDERDGLGWSLDTMGLTAIAQRYPKELSHGQRKLVGVARALAARPALLLLDEPAAGLDTEESLALGERLRRLPDAGVSVLLVDHDMGLVLGVCQHVIVLDFGRIIAAGAPDEIRGDPRVVEAYLGAGAQVDHA